MPVSSAQLWKCPRCGRRFAKRNQWHSCRVQSVDRHFESKPPGLRRLYRTLVRAMREFGPLRIDAVQSTINFVSTHHFGGLRVRRAHLRLGFLAERPILNPRIVRREVVGPRRIAHWVRVSSTGDIDRQLLGWLRRAHALQTRP